MPSPTFQQATQTALDHLARVVERAITDRNALTWEDVQILRAAASHAGQEAAAALGAHWDGEVAPSHDASDWRDMLVYVTDPF